MLEMRRLVAQNFLGGKPVHLESHFSYDLGDASYVGPLLGNRQHWVRQLPGQLLHNILSHGIAKLAEFLDDDLVEIVASAHQSVQLQNLVGQASSLPNEEEISTLRNSHNQAGDVAGTRCGASEPAGRPALPVSSEILDELRVLLRDASGTTAFFCFSTQLKPGLNLLRICGPVNSLTVDHASGSLLRHEKRSYKSYLAYFVPPLKNARQHFRNARVNLFNFLNGRLHQDSGMKELIERFYQSIRTQGEPPIPYREILLTARIMDEIFAQIYGKKIKTTDKHG
jgi:hypothetical protein